VQIGAVDGQVVGAVALHHGSAQRHAGQLGTAQGTAHTQSGRNGRDVHQGALQAPGLEPAHHIGPQLHAGTDFTEQRRALEQAHIPTGMGAGQCSRQAANTAPAIKTCFLMAGYCPPDWGGDWLELRRN
jgi:hypothetical protein